MKKVTDLKSFEEFAEATGLDAKALPSINVSGISSKHAKAAVSFYMLSIISEACWKLEEKVIDWFNWDQRKYYAWWDMSDEEKAVGSGSGFSYDGYGCVSASTDVGSRLVYPSKEALEHVVKTFPDLFEDVMVIPK